MPSEDYVLRKEFNNAKDNIDKRLLEHDREIATLKVLCSNLQGLPDEVSRLKTDIALVNQQLGTQNNLMCNLTKEFQTYITKSQGQEEIQDQRIKSIDEKSKVDFMVWVKEHWFEVATAIAVSFFALKEYF